MYYSGSHKYPPPAGGSPPASMHSPHRPEVVAPYTPDRHSSRGRRSHSGSHRSRRRRSRSSHGSRSRSRSPRSRSRRSRSRRSHASQASPLASEGFQYTKSPPPRGDAPQDAAVGGSFSEDDRPHRHHRSRRAPRVGADGGYPAFDVRDRAPEDRFDMRREAGAGGELGAHGSPWRGRAVVRGSFRLEGVDWSKYEALKEQPDMQRMFTTGLRDDLISEGGNGMTREDILLRLAPGPIRDVKLDYEPALRARGAGGRGAAGSGPTLVDAEWCVDVEYAIAVRSEAAQVNIANALFDSLSTQQMHLKATRAAYLRYIHPEHSDPLAIRAVPCVDADASSDRGSPARHDAYYSPSGPAARVLGTPRTAYSPGAPSAPHCEVGHASPHGYASQGHASPQGYASQGHASPHGYGNGRVSPPRHRGYAGY